MDNTIESGHNSVIVPTAQSYVQPDGAIHVQLPEPTDSGKVVYQVAVAKGDGNFQTLNFYLSPPTSSKGEVVSGVPQNTPASLKPPPPVVESVSPSDGASAQLPIRPTARSNHHYHPPLRSQPSVGRSFNPSGPTGVNPKINQLKNHEELRRRASYKKILDDISTDGTRDLFPPPLPAGIKKEVLQPENSDDSDPEDLQHETVQIPAAREQTPLPVSQSILVHPISTPLHPYNTNPAQLGGLSPYESFKPEPSYLPDSPLGSFDTDSPICHLSTGPEGMVIEATKRREIRLQKNREAARECRRKKKEYIKCLENRVQVLEQQNKALIEELKNLKEMYCHKPACSHSGQQ